MSEPKVVPSRRPRWLRAALALAAALAIALPAYLFWGSGSGVFSGTITITFLLVVPAVICAIAALITDPAGEEPLGHYLALPVLTLVVVIIFGSVFLGEGVICVLMLSPLWLVGGLVGSLLTRSARRRIRERGRLFAGTALLLPILAAQIEAALPVPEEWRTVSREVVIAAEPEQVWPLLVSIPSIGRDEGRWNVTQDVLGVPRPTEALLLREGGRAVRRARWGDDVSFEERIVALEPGRSIGWAFAFRDDSIRRHTDEHVAPDSAQLLIHSGRYRLDRLGEGRTRIRLETRYRLRTPLNFYAAWWGERLLGDIQDNVLAIVKQRAERL